MKKEITMEPNVELALDRWAEAYNKEWEKKHNWDEWIKANQHLPNVKALLARNEANDAKA